MVPNESELDTAIAAGEPARQGRSLPRKRRVWRGPGTTWEGERAMNAPGENQPPRVPLRDKQGGEATRRVAGAEPGVWSERMLTALARGVKGNQWFSLIDKVYADRTLALAWAKVRSNAGGSGVDRITIERFAKDCPRGLLDLQEQLRTASYQPLPVLRQRAGQRGRARGTGHLRWGHHYFDELGLFSMSQAQHSAAQSP